jgi:GH15 family glucan-1,4-alpha-glucosidase
LCLPDYDGAVVFGALLDSRKGGFWRVGPAELTAGEQTYAEDAPIACTRWRTDAHEILLTDAMALPHDARPDGRNGDRVVLRRLTCVRGAARCISRFQPSVDFSPVQPRPKGTLADVGPYVVWSDRDGFANGGATTIHEGETVWMVFAAGCRRTWTSAEAARLLDETGEFWSGVVRQLTLGPLHDRLRRSLITIRLLEYAPAGSVVAAPTTSVPERIGGGWNADYRLTWLRDASISIETLAKFGDLESGAGYLRWVSDRFVTTDPPLQVVYDIRGGTRLAETERHDVEGYRSSKPVRFGNHAFQQKQLDSFGYLADCALVFLECGGKWDPAFGRLLARVADYVVDHWTDEGNGIWELQTRRHYLSGRVMCWTALDRILRIGKRLGVPASREQAWRRTRDAIRREVETHGWSDRLRAFKQSLEDDVLDASALLIPIVGFLPADDPRVTATIDRIAERLTIDGCVYRFDPEDVPHVGPSTMGEFEAAFLPCTFWLATACALGGRSRDAADILGRAERVAGPLGLYAEAIDPRYRTFAGNTPLLFSHVEYVRAVCALACAQDLGISQ